MFRLCRNQSEASPDTLNNLLAFHLKGLIARQRRGWISSLWWTDINRTGLTQLTDWTDPVVTLQVILQRRCSPNSCTLCGCRPMSRDLLLRDIKECGGGPRKSTRRLPGRLVTL